MLAALVTVSVGTGLTTGPGSLAVTPSGAGQVPAAGAVTAPAPVGPAWRWRQYTAQRPRWRAGSCTPEVRARASEITARGAVVECATIRTPLDWTDLRAGSITLALTRVRHERAPVNAARAASARGPRLLLVNPGGPGMPAGWLAPAVAARTPALIRSHDIVAVDPRGAGGSTPVACPVQQDGQGDIAGATAAVLLRMQAATRATVDGCLASSSRLLPHLTSYDMAADLDLARRVLGRRVADFYGISAGTWLGARFAQQYPQAAGRIVLDGNTEFTGNWRASFALQPMGFQRRLQDQFFGWAARQHAAYGLGRTPASVSAAYASVRAAVAAGQLPGLTPRQFDAETVSDLYTDEGFVTLASRLRTQRRSLAAAARAARPARMAAALAALPALSADLVPGLGPLLLNAAAAAQAAAAAPGPDPGAAGPGSDASETVFMAVQCNDNDWSRDPGSYSAQGRALGKRYPVLGWEWQIQPCAYWPYQPKAAARAVSSRPLPAALMVQTELDPATPWEGALRAHLASPATRMVAVEDQGSHGAYLTANACVARSVDDYLMRGKLPARDRICAGLPLPRETRTYPVAGSLASALPRR